jgi:hypothetical protein
MNFWKDGLSIDESKISSLILMMLVCFGYAIYQCITLGDPTPGVIDLLKTLIYSVAGINLVSSLSPWSHSTLSTPSYLSHETQVTAPSDYNETI